MKKTIKITENELSKVIKNLITESEVKDISHSLISLDCTTDDLKQVVKRKLKDEFGYNDVKISFIGYHNKGKDLVYIVYTEGPVFVYKARSMSEGETPCLKIVHVVVYESSYHAS